jgi:hypothetical protein
MMNKVIDAKAICTLKELDLASTSCDNAKNALLRVAGRSPFGATFGRMPRLPGELLVEGDGRNLAFFDNLKEDQVLNLTDEYRIASLHAFHDTEAQANFRQSVMRKTRLRREPVPGQRVGVWRQQGPKKGPKGTRRPGNVIGVFTMFDSDRNQNNCWVHTSSGLKLVSREQLRDAAGWERWTPNEADLAALKKAERAFETGDFEDWREPGPQEDDPQNIVEHYQPIDDVPPEFVAALNGPTVEEFRAAEERATSSSSRPPRLDQPFPHVPPIQLEDALAGVPSRPTSS